MNWGPAQLTACGLARGSVSVSSTFHRLDVLQTREDTALTDVLIIRQLMLLDLGLCVLSRILHDPAESNTRPHALISSQFAVS